jgi:hypothetical protein
MPDRIRLAIEARMHPLVLELRSKTYASTAMRYGAFTDEDSQKKLLELGLHPLSLRVRTMNLLPPAEPGSWDADLANEVARNAKNYLLDRGFDVFVYAGTRVAQAFDFHITGYGYAESDYCVEVKVPHPSGLNRFWNDALNVEELRRRLHSVLCITAPDWEQLMYLDDAPVGPLYKALDKQMTLPFVEADSPFIDTDAEKENLSIEGGLE